MLKNFSVAAFLAVSVFVPVNNYASVSGAEQNLKLAKIALKLEQFADAKKHVAEGLNANPNEKTEKALKKVDKKISKKSKTHTIKGKITTGYETHSDIGAAPAAKAGGDVTDYISDDEDEDTEIEEPEDEMEDLDDLMEDDSFNDQDLEEVSDEADADGDSIPDIEDTDIDDDIAGGDGFFSKGKDSENRFSQGLKLSHSYLFCNKGGYRWNTAGAFVNANNEDRTELDRRSYAFSTGPVFNVPSLKLKVSPSVSYLTLIKDHNENASAWSYALGFSYKTTENLTLTAKVAKVVTDIEAMTAADSTSYAYKLGSSYKLTKEDIINFSFSPKNDFSGKVKNKKDNYGYSISYVRVLPWKMAASFTFGYKDAQFINLDPQRDDTTYKYAFQLGKKFDHGFSLTATLLDQEKKASLAGKDIRDQAFMLVAGWGF
ncbi:MAG TPA: hypothetical protein DIV86_04165 [Alphaproteobacteria bacterium]|nr:hypothetical protein [Alphaproteobacteria bacterium]